MNSSMDKCAHCGAPFSADSRRKGLKKYCGHLCRTAASHERIRGPKRHGFVAKLLEHALKGWHVAS